MTPAPTPPDLADYLQQLAASVGYHLDRDELDQACALHPDLVTAWVLAAARHGGLAHARSLLSAPATFLRERVAAGAFDDTTGGEVALLFALHEHDQHLETAQSLAAEDFAVCCRRLAAADTGLTSPVDRSEQPPGYPQPDPATDSQPQAAQHTG